MTMLDEAGADRALVHVHAPGAVAEYSGRLWYIYSRARVPLGLGATRADAWANAAQKLKRSGKG